MRICFVTASAKPPSARVLRQIEALRSAGQEVVVELQVPPPAPPEVRVIGIDEVAAIPDELWAELVRNVAAYWEDPFANKRSETKA